MESTRASDPPYALVPQLEARMAATEIDQERIERSLVLVKAKHEAAKQRLRKRRHINRDEVPGGRTDGEKRKNDTVPNRPMNVLQDFSTLTFRTSHSCFVHR